MTDRITYMCPKDVWKKAAAADAIGRIFRAISAETKAAMRRLTKGTSHDR